MKRQSVDARAEKGAAGWETIARSARDGTDRPGRPYVARPVGRRLGEILLSQGLLVQDDLRDVLAGQPKTGKRLGALLVEHGLLDERAVYGALAEQLGLPLIDLRRHAPHAEALAAIPASVARSAMALPIAKSGGVLRVAVADPSPAVRNQLATEAAQRIELALAPPSEITWAIDTLYRTITDINEHVEAFQSLEVAQTATRPSDEVAAEDAPVIHVVKLLITQALRDRASDIHVEPQGARLRVRYRVDGALTEALSLPGNMAGAVVSRIKILAGMNIVERRRPQDGQIAMEVDGRPVDIRVATIPTLWGEKTVLRLLDKTRSLYSLSDIGMPVDTYGTFSELIHSPFGMVLSAGPTGSGKTTTLYASLMDIDGDEANITTIEDPVEFIFPAINQIQINEQAGVTFAGGLRSILRQDPDIILVGEIRDVETARIAVQSALTGHLVLSSVHATDAASALQRFLDMGVESFLVASSVRAVLAQRLVRRTCSNCRVAYTPSMDELAFYREAGGPPKSSFWHGEGCTFCAHTGYHGRIGVFELLTVTERIKQLLVERSTHDVLRAEAVAQGMRPIRSEAARLIADDVTTIGEVIRKIYVL